MKLKSLFHFITLATLLAIDVYRKRDTDGASVYFETWMNSFQHRCYFVEFEEFWLASDVRDPHVMVLLENEHFLNELTKMFQKARLSGSVTMTFKRYDGHDKPKPRVGKPQLPAPSEYMCVVRARFKTSKISTVIHQKDVNKFQVAYSNFLKANLDGLKKLKKPKVKTKEA